jgi:hypothetical protein
MPYDPSFDDFGDDEFGASERRIGRLLQRRSKLEALLPVVGQARAGLIAKRIHHIDSVLARAGYSAQQGMAATAMAASGIEGVGGLGFDVQAPPGLGRLVRLPFYPSTATTGVITSAGLSAASTVNPVMIELVATTGGASSLGAHTLVTPQISWATIRIVGFETQSRVAQAVVTTTPPVMVCSDLQIGGGANLFTHEDYADATIYDADQPEFAGLRDYPIVKSPNTASVSVQIVGTLNTNVITFSCALLCEVLSDDNYGSHVPGPYARKGAMVRQGGSFV